YKFETYALPHGFVYPQIKQGANLLGNTPYEYIFDWYPYTFDAKFWLDEFLFGTPPEKRVNGRQFQQIFMNYKMGEVDWQSIWLGLGYSEFEAGSILLEEDFVSQVYNLGVFGEVLTVVPYIGVLLWGVYEVLRRWKKLLTLEVSCYAMSFVFALASGYISGHTLDQFTTTMFIALSVSVLLSRIQEAKHD
ncbi:MAG: O-antigen ligase family protein, partial [Erysipelotrichaceae bacterium]|nr:O-antigen ligase family protein [Erysipelotrichaceae bacterium]